MNLWVCTECGEGDIDEYVKLCPFCDSIRSEYSCNDIDGDRMVEVFHDIMDDIMYNVGVAVHEKNGGYVAVLYSNLYESEQIFIEFPPVGSFYAAMHLAHTELVEFIQKIERLRNADS